MMNEFARHLLVIGLGYVILMIVAWVIAWKLNFFSLVDAVWAIGIGAGSTITLITIGGISFRTLIACSLALFWGLRLGLYLSQRLKKHYPIEDTRYQKLKQQWVDRLKLNTFLFFVFQGITQAVFTIPFLLSSMNLSPFPEWTEVLGAGIVVIGVLGESVSDSQLKRFKSSASNHGKVCDVGLWKFSRHPNYFFEWTIWVGLGLFSLGSLSFFLSMLAPVLMLYLLLFVTGVRPSEEQSLKSRGEAYIQYQKRTSSFIPWFPKTTKKLS